MTCPNCKRTIKAVESVNGVTGEVSVNFCPGCGAMMPGTNYEQSNTSCLQLCQSLFGGEWRAMVRAMPVIIAYNADEIGRKELESILGYDLDIQGQIRLKAIAAGVKLARGEG